MEQNELLRQLNSTEKKQVLVQYAIIALLACVLVSLIAGYVYYGMEQAKEVDVPSVDQLPPQESTETNMSPEERQAILEALDAESKESTIPPEERQAILEALDAETSRNSN